MSNQARETTFGGKLSQRHEEWVLHDVTCHTRWLLQIVRAVVLIAAPAAIVAVCLMGWDSVWLVVVGGVACGVLLGLWYTLAYIEQTGDRRLVKQGYEPGTLRRALRERYNDEHADEIARYRQMYRGA
jgi:uncharacterized protein DUF5313